MVGRDGERGFSLIELMVTMALMALLAMLSAPFTLGWANAAAVQRAQSQLLEGAARLKALALSNPAMVEIADGATPAAVLVNTGSKICVYAGTPASLDCAAEPRWQAELSASVKMEDAFVHCIAFNNFGLPMTAMVSDQTCLTTLHYAVTRGQESVSGTLH